MRSRAISFGYHNRSRCYRSRSAFPIHQILEATPGDDALKSREAWPEMAYSIEGRSLRRTEKNG
jgi:hypothetical protein